MSTHGDSDSTIIAVELEHIEEWRYACESNHGSCCNDRYSELLAEHLNTLNFVDVTTLSLVTLPSSTCFVALSYVWGDVPVFKATKANLASLQQAGALSGTSPGIALPKTIRDAIHLTKELGERYLWVDCLCILQDAGAEEMNTMLRAMARIYAAAEITIVAAGGENADQALRGIGGPSHHGYPRDSKWASRGWTFQESLFARRLLVIGKTITWICGRDIWVETKGDFFLSRADFKSRARKLRMLADIKALPGPERLHLGVPMGMMSILPQLPNLGRWGMLVENFSERSVTHEHERESAFAGATEVMSSTFPGGIFQGLPEFYFDIALLWQPEDLLHRRKFETPSWSWTGWTGSVKCLLPWHPFSAGMYRLSGDLSDWLVIAPLKSTAQFRKRDLLTNELVPIRNDFFMYQALRYNPDAILPEGWSYHSYPGGHFYRWDQEQGTKARYGYPLPRAGPKHSLSSSSKTTDAADKQPTPSFSHILHITCPSLTLHFSPNPVPHRDGGTLSTLVDLTGRAIGCLLHFHPEIVTGTPLRLIAISEAEVKQPEQLVKELISKFPLEWNIKTWEQDLLSEGESLGFYNVLWVVDKGDVVHREGIGKVGKSAWDRMGPEMVTLNLG